MDVPGRIEAPARIYHGPGAYALADWRLRTAALYHAVRSAADPGKGWRYWRDTRRAMFQAHPVSPIAPEARAGYGGPNLYGYDPALRFAVDLAPADGPLETVDLGPDGILERRSLAVTNGLVETLSAELTLYWIGGYGGGLFLPFRDLTSGTETYGGGRYLIDAIKGADLGLDARGRLILDFNFAYHPSCAHDAAFVCPLAPPENALPVAVRAGERL
jgi:uncharacterized protein